MRNKAIACLGAIVACATALAGIPATAMADDSAGLTPQYTYNSQNDNGMTFEKVSHADQGLSQADGVVDYTGDGTIAPYTAGLSTTGNGDRGQSYSYAAASSGDWVYIGTMYGGLGVQAILNRDMTSLGLTSKQATALIQTMYAGNMYLGEPDGKSAGGMLFKFNVKTGKTKILMSKSTGIDGGKGVIPTFRSAFKMNGKLYFEGMVMDTNNKDLTQQEIQTAMAYQNGFPCIYEVDPANNDKLTKVYDSVDVDGFRSLVKGNVFTSTRAIGSFGNTLIAGDLKPTADGKGKALLVASKTPSDPNSYKVIADMASFDNLPAIHRQDVNGGGGIYQVQEFNGKLYVVVCTGDTSTLNEETGTMRSFAIYVGENKGDSTNKADWTWRPLVGDTAKGAKYYYGLDKSRVSAGACTLQVYGDHLYIGDYNDVSSALQGFVTKSNFVTQATNLEQSVNLYRMDKNENVEMLVGDKNDTFPKGVKELPEEELNEGEVKGDEEKYGLAQAFKLLVKNKYYMMSCGTYILQQLYSAMIGAGIYYMTWVLKNKNLFGQFAWAVNIPLIIALIFTPTLVGKWNGMYKLNLRGYIIAVIGRALVVVAGYMGSIPLMLAFTALAALGQGPWQGDMNAVIASCSEYTYLTQGKRIDGTMYSCTSLGVKIGGGIGTAVCGWLLELSGYVGTNATQPQSALDMMQFMYLWLPLIFDVLIMIVLSRMNVEAVNEKLKAEKGIKSDEVTDATEY